MFLTRVRGDRSLARASALKPRKTPAQRRSAATVDAILEGAARVLEERGLEGYNTNAVAERAGVSVGSLYQYFPNKDALTAALIAQVQAEHLATLRRAVDEALARELALAEALRHLLKPAFASHRRMPGLSRALDYEEARLPVGPALAEARLALHGEMERLLQAHRRGVAVSDIARAAADVWLIVHSLFDAAEQDGSAQADPAGLEARLLRAALGYLCLPADYSAASAWNCGAR